MKQDLDPLLLEILRCPNCKGTLEHDPSAQLLRCEGECGLQYPVVDGIPHMIVEEATKP